MCFILIRVALNAKPVTPEGRIKEDPEKVRERVDAMVKLALDGRCSLLILGGVHDLSASIRRLSSSAEYIRVTTRRYKELHGGSP